MKSPPPVPIAVSKLNLGFTATSDSITSQLLILLTLRQMASCRLP
jgi:hypothetical protein